MMFYINPGELRTQIRIQQKVTTGSGSFAVTTWADIGNTHISCKWEAQIKGTQTMLSDATQVLGYATATIRYLPDVSPQCRIVKDGIVYHILGISDPDQHRRWLQIAVKAAMTGE